MYKKFFVLALWFTSYFIQASCSIPVVFVHSGDAFYLQNSLIQAKKFNDRVILIGDETNKHYVQDGIEYYPIDDFSKSSNSFRMIYRHMSKRSCEEELIRFTRWFILDEFMKAKNIPISFYLKSNVMLYCDISSEYITNFNKSDIALELQHGFCNGLVSYWNSQAISSFCSFLMKFYENTKQLNILEDQFKFGGEHYQDDWPHMTNWLCENSINFKIGNLSNLINNTTFDSSIWHDYLLVPNAASVLEYKRYRMKYANLSSIENTKRKKQKLRIKDIIWNQGLPYCYSADLGAFVQLKALYFAGESKNFIVEYKSAYNINYSNEGPYASINTLPFYMLGFFSLENQKHLEHFIKTHKPKTIIELGSWLGASAAFMAFFMPENGKLYAVDHFDMSLDSYLNDSQDIKGTNDLSGIPKLYHQFLSNIIHYKLCDKIIPIKMDTLEASHSLNVQADLIYVDASNDEESVYQNIMHWHRKLNKGGIICGSNWKWFESVRKGVTRAAEELNKTIKIDHNFWYFDFI